MKIYNQLLMTVSFYNACLAFNCKYLLIVFTVRFSGDLMIENMPYFNNSFTINLFSSANFSAIVFMYIYSRSSVFFEESFCRCPVYFINQNDIIENRPGFKIKLPFPWINYKCSGYITWQLIANSKYFTSPLISPCK